MSRRYECCLRCKQSDDITGSESSIIEAIKYGLDVICGLVRYPVSYPVIQQTRLAYGMVQGLSNPLQGEWLWDGQAGTQALVHRDSYLHLRQRRTEC
jgi:hypothetical protein